MKTQKLFFISILLFNLNFPIFAESINVRNVKQAINLAIDRNPELKAQKHRLLGSQAVINQANSLPNPQLNLETEDFSGSNSGFDQSENTFSISQKIELGGKRSARKSLAENQANLEQAKTQLKLAQLIRDVEIAFARVILSQKLLSLTDEQKTFTENVLKTVKEKVEFGGIIAGEETKAKIALQLISIEQQKARNQLFQSKQNLAVLWNGQASQISGLVVDNNYISQINMPPISQFLATKARTSQIDVSESLLIHEEAAVIPDITFTGGYRRFEDTDTDAFVAGISVPLPIFNLNRGRVKQAEHELNASKFDYEQFKINLETQVNNLLQTREVLLIERDLIAKQLLPSSKLALKQIREAYELGRIGYLDLIDSRRAYFDSRIREAENLYALKVNEVTITASSGQILANILKDGEKSE